MQQSMHLHSLAPICIYTALKKHANTQINMVNVYVWPIYLFSRLNICIYGLHICIYGDFYPSTPTKLHIYIYIYSVKPQITA